MKSSSRWFFVALCLLPAFGARAASLLGLKFADDVTVSGQKLVLNGMGIRKAEVLLGFKVDVYVGALYLKAKSQDAKAILASLDPKFVRMSYAHAVDKEKARTTWKENFQKLCSSCEALKPHLETFLGALEDMKEDEFQEYEFTPQGVRFFSKKKEKVVIPSADFGKFLLRVWLETPPNPELRDGMLGLAPAKS